jgi:hypothetical protein
VPDHGDPHLLLPCCGYLIWRSRGLNTNKERPPRSGTATEERSPAPVAAGGGACVHVVHGLEKKKKKGERTERKKWWALGGRDESGWEKLLTTFVFVFVFGNGNEIGYMGCRKRNKSVGNISITVGNGYYIHHA